MRWAVAWLLYWVGDGISWFMFKGLPVYRAYNWCMITSADIQGDNTNGPWGKSVRA